MAILLSRVRRIVVGSDYFLSRCLTEKGEEETERVWKGGRGEGGAEGQRGNQDRRGWSKEACWKKRQEIQELNSVHFIS